MTAQVVRSSLYANHTFDAIAKHLNQYQYRLLTRQSLVIVLIEGFK